MIAVVMLLGFLWRECGNRGNKLSNAGDFRYPSLSCCDWDRAEPLLIKITVLTFLMKKKTSQRNFPGCLFSSQISSSSSCSSSNLKIFLMNSFAFLAEIKWVMTVLGSLPRPFRSTVNSGRSCLRCFRTILWRGPTAIGCT